MRSSEPFVTTGLRDTRGSRPQGPSAIHDRALEDMSDAHIKQALDVAALPADFFEANIGRRL